MDLSAIPRVDGRKLAYDTASTQAAARKYVPHIAVRQFQTEAERQLVNLPRIDGLVSGAEHVRTGVVVMRSYRSGTVKVNQLNLHLAPPYRAENPAREYRAA